MHAGLICLDGPAGGFDLDTQHELFEIALNEIDRDPDIVNQVLEVTLENGGDAQVTIRRYRLPEA